jgi:hypothetical protein
MTSSQHIYKACTHRLKGNSLRNNWWDRIHPPITSIQAQTYYLKHKRKNKSRNHIYNRNKFECIIWINEKKWNEVRKKSMSRPKEAHQWNKSTNIFLIRLQIQRINHDHHNRCLNGKTNHIKCEIPYPVGSLTKSNYI